MENFLEFTKDDGKESKVLITPESITSVVSFPATWCDSEYVTVITTGGNYFYVRESYERIKKALQDRGLSIGCLGQVKHG